MKKRTFVFLFCCVLAIAAALGIVGSLLASREQVAVTVTEATGDPNAAQGLTIQQAAQYRGTLRWDLTIPADRPEDTTTEFTKTDPYDLSYYLPHSTFRVTQGLSLHGNDLMPEPLRTDPDPGTPYTDEHFSPEMRPYFPIFCHIAEQTGPRNTNIQQVRLSDHLDVLPIPIESFGGGAWFVVDTQGEPQDLGQVLTDYFSFPIPQDLEWTFILETNEGGDVTSLEVRTGDYGDPVAGLEFRYDWGADDLYLAMGPYGGPELDFSHTPGGYGIYRMDYTWNSQGQALLQGDSMETFYPLPEEAQVLNLALSPQDTWLYVIYVLEDTAYLLVLDAATGAEFQTLPLTLTPGESGTWIYPSILPQEDCLLVAYEYGLHFYALRDGQFAQLFLLPRYQERGIDVEFLAWNGETLAMAGIPYLEQSIPVQTHLWLYNAAGQPLYEARYRTSLNWPGEAAEELPYFPTVQSLYEDSLSLTWAEETEKGD